tara:strand:+ start:2947 stop:3372 length:426 start_codon:yes stop_codon:yes gene_type:complete
MTINYSWRIEDMQWDNGTGMVVSVNAAYVGTFNGKVGSATTVITEERNKLLLLNSSSSPIGINTLTPSDVKGWLNNGFASELPNIQKEMSDALFEKKDQFLHDQHIVTYSSQDWKYYRPAGINSDRNLPNSSWLGEPEVGK